MARIPTPPISPPSLVTTQRLRSNDGSLFASIKSYVKATGEWFYVEAIHKNSDGREVDDGFWTWPREETVISVETNCGTKDVNKIKELIAARSAAVNAYAKKNASLSVSKK